MKKMLIQIVGTSMIPTLMPNNKYCVYKVDLNTIKSGDIIVYNKGFRYITAHRVYNVLQASKKKFFLTKGDNNDQIDEYVVKDDEIIGKIFI